MEFTLESLGFTKEELQEKVIERLCQQVMEGTAAYDEDREEYFEKSAFAKKLKGLVTEHIDAKIHEIAAEHVLPRMSEFIENLILQKTNCWGEKQGQSVTIIEYIVQRAEAYMTEKVDLNGKPNTGRDSYWKASDTRIGHMIDGYLKYHIETAMKDALTTANNSIAEGISATVKMKLEEITKTLRVSAGIKK